MTTPLGGKRILVVGGGRQDYDQPDPPAGIGRAISVLCAQRGAALIIADRDPDAARRTVEDVTRHGGSADWIAYDAADEDSAAAGIKDSAERLGGLDGLVMNTGIVGGWDLEHTPAEAWDQVFAVNVRAHFLGCKHGLAHASAGASFVLTSSTAARLPTTSRMPAYGASKAALDGLCRYAAKEAAARGARVNIVMPGLIDTPLGRLATAAKPDRAGTPIPLGRQGTAWDVAEGVAFLLSSAASYITGHTLTIDGGLSTLG